MNGGGRRRKPAGPDPVHGVLLIDKPQGWTSHDVVHRIRRQFNLRKTGHGGTLDPNATGLLPILVGRGTKVSDKVMSSDKEYVGTLRLGVRTDSQDSEGETIESAPWDAVTEEQIRDQFAAFTGDQEQIPPMVSAVKKDGVPLYKLARKGQSVERDPRPITVHVFEFLGKDGADVRFRIRCTKGTYVRTLCDDIGQRLGCGAHLAALTHTETGGCRLEDAHPLSEVETWTLEDLEQNLVPLRFFAKA